MNFIFSCWQYLSLVRFAHSWEVLSALEDKIRIPVQPCNIPGGGLPFETGGDVRRLA